MPQRVAERLRRDRVRRHLDRGVRLAEVVDAGRAQRDLVPGGQLPQRAGEPALVEHRRAQPVHERPQLADAGRSPSRSSRARSAQLGLARLVELAGQRLELERGPGQGRGDTVVQVGAEPAAFLLAGDDDPAAAAGDVGDQRRRRTPGCRRGRDLLDRRLLLGGPLLAGGAEPDVQLADGLARARSRSRRGCRAAGVPDATLMPPPVNAAYGSRSASRSPSTSRCSASSGCEAAATPRPTWATTAYALCRCPKSHRSTICLHPVARGGGDQGRDRHQQDAPAEPGATRLGAVDDADVDRDHEAGQQAEDDRAVEGELDVEEPVPQHADADAEREADQADGQPQHSAAPPNGSRAAHEQGDAAEEEPLQLGALDVRGAPHPQAEGEHGRAGRRRGTGWPRRSW